MLHFDFIESWLLLINGKFEEVAIFVAKYGIIGIVLLILIDVVD